MSMRASYLWRRLPIASLGVLCLLCSSCVFSPTPSDHPLSDPGRAKPDRRLEGAWLPSADSGSGFLVKEAEGNMQEMVSVTPDGALEPAFRFFPTPIGGYTYLNMQIWEDKAFSKTYYLAKYDIGLRHLTLRSMSTGTLADAIDRGRIKGIVKREKGRRTREGEEPGPITELRLTDTSENLVKYLRTGDQDALFPRNQQLFFSDSGDMHLRRACEDTLTEIYEDWTKRQVLPDGKTSGDTHPVQNVRNPIELRPLKRNLRRKVSTVDFMVEFKYLRWGKTIYTVTLNPALYVVSRPIVREVAAKQVAEEHRIDIPRLPPKLQRASRMKDPIDEWVEVKFFDKTGKPVQIKTSGPNPHEKYGGSSGSSKTYMVAFPRWFPRGGYAVVTGAAWTSTEPKAASGRASTVSPAQKGTDMR